MSGTLSQSRMIGELKAAMDEGDFSSAKAELLSYSSDASQIQGDAVAVAWPRSREQAAAIVKIAARHAEAGANIVPRGAGTGLAGAAVPQNSIVLDFSRMNRILELDIEKRAVTVEPGVVLDDLNAYLAQFGLFFPVIPASHRVCTLGGMISTDAAGERAMRYGRTSAWVEGLEVIDGKGETRRIKGGEARVFCGKEGILGMITKANLSVIKIPKASERRSVSLLKFSSAHELIDAVNDHKRSKDVTAIEFFNGMAAEIAGLEARHHLFIEFESGRGQTRSEDEIRKVWGLRESMGPLISSEGYTVMEDPQLPAEGMEEFLGWLEKKGLPSFGHIGMGIIHPRFRESQGKLITEMFGLVRKLKGNVSGEHGIGLAKRDFADRAFVEKARLLKRKYDPEGIMNKGKVI